MHSGASVVVLWWGWWFLWWGWWCSGRDGGVVVGMEMVLVVVKKKATAQLCGVSFFLQVLATDLLIIQVIVANTFHGDKSPLKDGLVFLR